MDEYSLDLNRELAMENLKVALTRSRQVGRLEKLNAADIEGGWATLAAGIISVTWIARRLGSKRDTCYSYFRPAQANSAMAEG